MTLDEKNALMLLAWRWLNQTCSDAEGCTVDCGDPECIAMRICADELRRHLVLAAAVQTVLENRAQNAVGIPEGQ
jgi:hypothetical protein